MVTRSQFRVDFPAFADETVYPDSILLFWLAISTSLVNAERWADLTDMGVELMTAHQVRIGTANIQAGNNGGSPGAMTGIVTSQSVGDVSVSRDIGSVTLTDGGFWNLTTYGVRFLQLARMFGAGPVQL